MTLYRKTALVSAEQFLPSEDKIPAGVFSGGLSDPRKSPAEWCLQTLEGRHTLRNGDYICTGPNGEKWNVEQSIFEATYEAALASPPVSERERELEEFVGWVRSQVHNLPRSATADLIDQRARALTAQPAGEPTHG